MFKLLVSDIDGTLIGDDEILVDDIVKLSKELAKKDILFTLATGRVESLTHEYIEKLSIELPVILSNGATIIQGDKVIQRKTVPVKSLKGIIEACLDRDISVVYTINGIETPFNLTDWILSEQIKHPNYKNILPFNDDDWENTRIDKLMLYDASLSGIISEIEEIAKGLPSEYTYTRYIDRAIEIVDSSATKASALEVVQEQYDVKAEETIVIGDHRNDIEMFQHAGFSVAVQNAIPELKKRADYITKGSYGDGVIEVMELLLRDQLKK